MKIVIGCRHGQALKNLKHVYGGKGSLLTEAGTRQVEEFAKKLNQLKNVFDLPIYLYVSTDRIHLVESANIIKDELGLREILFDEGYSPINLGVFGGISRDEQGRLYPQASQAHKEWEEGRIDISQFECLVDGMQTASSYMRNFSQFLSNLPDGTISILLGTRSDLICLKNIVNHQSADEFMGYKFYDIDFTENITAIIKNNEIIACDFETLINKD